MRFLLALLCFAAPLRADLLEVDVELFLAVDVSRSMQPYELEIQRQGYAAALKSDEVQAAIGAGLLGRIAITYVEWAGAGNQRVIVPWRLVEGTEDAHQVADEITAFFDASLRRTSISSALMHAVTSIEGNGFEGLRRVIDISGDGPNNMGPPVEEARDYAVERGITINGIPLMTQDDGVFSRWSIPDLDVYYTRCVIGGPGAFVLPVTDWSAFAASVRRKLVLEIAGREPQIHLAQSTAQAPYNCLIGEEIWDRNSSVFMEP